MNLRAVLPVRAAQWYDRQASAMNAPWRTDPLLAGRFHQNYPDDLQVVVHDGGPRLSVIGPELMWVRLHEVAPAEWKPGVHEHAAEQIRAHVVTHECATPASHAQAPHAGLDLVDRQPHVSGIGIARPNEAR